MADSNIVMSGSEKDEKYQDTGLFNMTQKAKNTVAEKRKKKGLGQVKKRERSVFH